MKKILAPLILFFLIIITDTSAYAKKDNYNSTGQTGGRISYDGHGTEYDPELPISTVGNKNFNVTSDENGITITMNDKARTSSIWYSTFGMSLSRCKFDPAIAELHSGKASNYIVTLLPLNPYGIQGDPGVSKKEYATDSRG